MTGILFSLIPLFAWGAGDYIASKLSKKVNGFSLSFFFSLVGWAAVMPIAVFMGASQPSAEQVLKFLIGSVGVNAGFILMLRGFTNGPAGIVAPIANAYAIVTALVSWIVFDQNLTILSGLGIAIVVSGITLVSYAKPTKGEFKNERVALVSSLLALVCFGIGFSFFGQAATGEWYENSLWFQTINIIVGGCILLLLQRKGKVESLKKIARFRMSYIGGSLGSLGALGLFVALGSIDRVAVPAAIAAAAPSVTALLAYIFEKEHLTLLQRSATVVIISGIVVLALSTS